MSPYFPILPERPSPLFTKILQAAGRDLTTALWSQAGEAGLEAGEALLAAVEMQSSGLIHLIYQGVKTRSFIPELSPEAAPALLALGFNKAIQGRASALIDLLDLCADEIGAFKLARESALRFYGEDSFLQAAIRFSVLQSAGGPRREPVMSDQIAPLARALASAFWTACPKSEIESVARAEIAALSSFLDKGRCAPFLTELLRETLDSALAIEQKAQLQGALIAGSTPALSQPAEPLLRSPRL